MDHSTIQSTQNVSTAKQHSQRCVSPSLITQTNKPQNEYFYSDSSFNRCCVEDFISLPRRTFVNLLILQKLVFSMKKRK